nr:hypothetical protein [Tanacetum cinerariifolium]
LNWNEHEAENKTEEGEQVYGLMARFKSDFADHAGNATGSVYDAAVEFAMIGISPKDWYHKTQLALEEKVRLLSANLENTTNTLKFVKAGEMHEVSPSITRTFMPTSYKSDLEETLITFGSKSNTSSINTSESNDFVSCDNSDKSLESETYDFKSCVSSSKTNDSFFTVDVKILRKNDVKDPSPTNGFPSCSFKENVKPPRNLCYKSGIADRIHCKNNFVRTKTCFVCRSKSHLIKDYDVYDNVDNFPSVVSKAAYVPASSRNSSASISAGRSIPAASRNKRASIHVGRHILAGRFNKPAPFPAGLDLSELINQAMLESVAYKTYYAFASGEKTPKTNKKDFHISHASVSGDGVNTQSQVLDEQQPKTSGTDEGTCIIPGVPDVAIYDFESDKESWVDNDEEDDKNNFKDAADNNDDDTDDDDNYELTNDEENIDEEEEDEVTKDLYDDVNVNLGNEDTEMTNADQGATEQKNASHHLCMRQLQHSLSFELTKILIDKMEKNKSCDVANYKRELYDALVKSYNTDKDIFESYGEVFSLNRSQDDKRQRSRPLRWIRLRDKKWKLRCCFYQKIHGQRKRSLQAPLKMPLNIKTSLLASLPMQRSQVILFKIKACNKIKSSSQETMMNNPLIRRLPKQTSLRNPSDF